MCIICVDKVIILNGGMVNVITFWCGIYFVNVSVTISVGEFESLLLLLIGLVGIVENI